jgi:hypothetical protein
MEHKTYLEELIICGFCLELTGSDDGVLEFLGLLNHVCG